MEDLEAVELELEVCCRAQVVTRNSWQQGRALLWMAPEVYQRSGKRPSPCSDVFSYGRVCAFLLTGLRPLDGMTRQQVIATLASGSVPPLRWPGCSVLEELLNVWILANSY